MGHRTTGTSTRGACQGIVPPYLLEALARSGSLDPERVDRTLQVDARNRARRAAALAAAPSRPSPRAARAAEARPQRTVLDASSGEPQPARAEGDPPVGDATVNRAYDGLGETFAFYRDVFERDSLDGAGLPLRAQVHVGRRWDNAEWDGEQMLFGDGDGEVFGDFTASLDVIGHELTHGVTQYESQFVYQDQSGALNESMSDVFGSMVRQYSAGQTVERADWLIGAELLLPGVHGVALRSMKAPGTAYDDPRLGGKDPQPAHMRDYVRTADDEGGVHLNSGIPNLAFYLAASALGGHSWEGAGRVWYAALTDPATSSTSTFAQFAAATVRLAGEAADAVGSAWTKVGVTPAAT
ncbi:thermolysin metallopeptidase-like protein [Motilibacter peucedani]|uniref:Neutral metalloproteinase n=1 Tax=Motilibacter peucedani TaxID=598650 RepID=A0A420XNW1_9ACTN|nr:M4 family metallopeptidase [Motilibacter peucedani]RKS73866.1 thermolysin metallopeptidase-like protein [Motilibacter peucedani]